MKSMIEKKFVNEDLEIELTSFIDDKQNVWFRGKDVAEILGYSKQEMHYWSMLITTKRGRQVPNTESLLYFYKSIRFLLLSIYKWTEPWNIKGRFPESWGHSPDECIFQRQTKCFWHLDTKRCWSIFEKERWVQCAPLCYTRWKYLHYHQAVITWSWRWFKEQWWAHSTDDCSPRGQTKCFWHLDTKRSWSIFEKQQRLYCDQLCCIRCKYLHYHQAVITWSWRWFMEQ